MSSPNPDGTARGSDEPLSDDDLTEFLSFLNELKASGCALLVVGDCPRDLLTRASSRMLGDDDVTRYRVLGVTDATPSSIAERLPDPGEAPQPIEETTHVLNHAGAVRSVTTASNPATPPDLAGVKETRIADPGLTGLQRALIDAIEEFGSGPESLDPAELRVGVDSLAPLLDFYEEDVVRRCLRIVGGHARDHDAMAHYVLPKPYDSDVVQSLATDVDGVVEVRVSGSAADSPAGEQRWHVPDRNLTAKWIPL